MKRLHCLIARDKCLESSSALHVQVREFDAHPRHLSVMASAMMHGMDHDPFGLYRELHIRQGKLYS